MWKGDVLSLFCNATGNPTPNITWTKTGGSGVLGTGNTLVVSNESKASDAGEFRCAATNALSTASKSATVAVLGKVVSNYLHHHEGRLTRGDILQGHVAATLSPRQIPSCERSIFMKNLVAGTKFCPRDMSPEFKSV